MREKEECWLYLQNQHYNLCRRTNEDKGWTRTLNQLTLQHLHKSIYLKENEKQNQINHTTKPNFVSAFI